MPHKRKLRREEPMIIEAYTKHNRTLRELACFHGCSTGTIRNILLRNGIDRRKRGRRKK